MSEVGGYEGWAMQLPVVNSSILGNKLKQIF